ncbi:MAG: mechanosensitive ion channel family protein [Candidatus Thermoplasmatota archaeon]
MERSTRRISKLILWEIVLLFVLALLFTYMPTFVKMESLNEVLTRFLRPSLMILFVIIVTKLFLSLLKPVFQRALDKYLTSSYEVKYTWQFISYLVWIASFIILSFLILGDLLTIGVFVAALILIIILISHKAIANFSGWLHIIFGSSMRRGDLVEIDGIKGRVSEVSTMKVVLDEKSGDIKDPSYTGRKVNIPNSLLFSKPVFTISTDDSLIWDEIRVLLPPETNHLLAEDILVKVAKSIVGPIMNRRKHDMVKKMSSYSDVPSVPTTRISIEENGVLIVLRYFCLVSERSSVRSAISEGVLKEFKKEGIDITFKD